MSTTTIRERPILFSGPMVRAILAGRKVQTRRIAKPPKGAVFLSSDHWTIDVDEPGTAYHDDFNGRLRIRCTYGATGDRLWVRETFLHSLSSTTEPCGETYSYYTSQCIEYVADGAKERFLRPGEYGSPWMKKRPAIHMPRWASRITLEITEVRVERLNDITDADAKAEGLLEWTDPPRIPSKHYGLSVADVWESDPRQAFARIWDQINGKRPGCSWADNPWVWALTFRRVGMEGE